MSCEECDKKQDLAFNKNIAESTGIAYVRVGASNVAIVACPEHGRQLIDEMRKWRRF
ncbi:hypothetical protein LCGC14_2064220 [marine sediment metagenome]|uniref:Uncharacterized protein n=1 Tax=marine sediment metagenome TaxID=412755 RepID=A0A0F9F7M7_9ZZZZ